MEAMETMGTAAADIGEALEGMTSRLRRSVVAIVGRAGAGAGTVWRSGVVATNSHVVRGERVRVETSERRVLEARLVARDSERDLALLRLIESDPPLEPVAWRDPSTARVGELVVAVGHPWGQRGEATLGVVSRAPAAGLGLASAVLADVRLAPGNSGGPLADASGRVLGINAMITGGLAVAVPATAVEALLSEGDRRPGILGVGGFAVPIPASLSAEVAGLDGLLVTEVLPGSAAERAGLIPGDVIVAANGASGAAAVASALRGLAAERALRFGVLRGGRLVTVEAVPAAA